jgi:glutamyl-tRNA reductase
MEILLLGVSHHSAPAAVRDALAMERDEVAEFLQQLQLPSGPITELVVMSTCNRTEFYASVTDWQQAGQALCDACDTYLGVPHLGDPDYAFVRRDADAVTHLFRVAAGLDSMMIGEHQILGQVRDALVVADAVGTSGVLTDRLFHAAAKAGNRARNETGIARGAVSVALASVRMAGKVLGELASQRVLVVGAGETGQLVAKHFAKESPASLVVMNRTLERAQVVADELRGTAQPLDQLATALHDADVVVTATSSPEPIITRAMLTDVVHARAGRPLVIVDIASPRDVDPGARDIPELFLYDLDSLQSIVEQNRRAREKEVPKAERILQKEVNHFLEWYRALQVKPTIRALRLSFEEIAREEAERHAKHFHRTEREFLDKFTGALVNKLLHHPTIRIKQLDRSTGDGVAKLAAVQDLFALIGERAPAPSTEREGG